MFAVAAPEPASSVAHKTAANLSGDGRVADGHESNAGFVCGSYISSATLADKAIDVEHIGVSHDAKYRAHTVVAQKLCNSLIYPQLFDPTQLIFRRAIGRSIFRPRKKRAAQGEQLRFISRLFTPRHLKQSEKTRDQDYRLPLGS
jgi:hypothetical protein